MDHDPGLERPRGVHRHDQRIAVVGQLHDGARRVHPHHADEGIEHGGVETAAPLREHQRERLVRRHRLGTEQRIAQPVEAVHQRHDAGADAHAVGVQALRKAAAVGVFMVLGDDQQRPGAHPHLLAHHHALGDVLLVGGDLGGGEAVVAMAEAGRQLHLADVVQQRALAEVQHLVAPQAEGPAQQHRDHRDVQRMRGAAVAGALVEQADVDVALDQHLVQQRAGQRGGPVAGVGRLARHQVDQVAQGGGRLGVLALAQQQRLALLGQQPTMTLAGIVLGVVSGLGDHGRSGGRRRHRRGFQRELALARAPAHLLQAQPAQDQQLLLRTQLEAAEREGMRHPAEVEMNEHPHFQLVHIDERIGRSVLHSCSSASGSDAFVSSFGCPGPQLK